MSDDERRRAADELALCRAWNAGWFDAGALRTTDGRPVTVVYRGRWTFGFGPDFQGALIAFGAELRQGDVEIDLRPAGWREHGHHLNAAYDRVILHAVLNDERGPVCRRRDKQLVPTLALGPALRGPLDALPPDPALPALGTIADQPCIAEITPANRAAALAALERAGDARLTAKAAVFEAAFTTTTPGQALYAGLLDALGYTRNRAPMAALAAALPLAALEERLPASEPRAIFRTAAALLLGVAGLLPCTPALAELLALPADDLAAIEETWPLFAAPWRETALPLAGWSLARTRPANHPARRLLGLAAILARGGRAGLLTTCLEPCTAEAPTTGLAELRGLLTGPARQADQFGRYIGADRTVEMIVNVVLPFALAYAAWAGDERLGAGAAALWEVVPASAGNEPVRALAAQIAGGATLRLKTGRQQQGALHLFRHYCEHRRCYECPIARLNAARE
ncbi:MAG: DUF2851 family protein [Thermomicrobiales bacterium]